MADGYCRECDSALAGWQAGLREEGISGEAYSRAIRACMEKEEERREIMAVMFCGKREDTGDEIISI